METLFPLGQLLATPGAIQAAHEAGDNLLLYICRHAAGDWGDLSREDMRAMSLLKRLLGKRSEPPKQRVRICVECGMPVAEHKQWCSILQGQIEMKLRAAEATQKP